ncbi:MAG: hydrogenase maturation nickel metallochaperone HypA [Thiomicrospira sp.]|nr:MAG: hydrogenase maturation nickel metallochaperone HypA [Thiomicrospira sp.]
MHEYSIVQALIEQCETLAETNQASHVSKVSVKIGQLSGVEPYLLQTAFEAFKQNSDVCQQAELDMQIQAVEVFCLGCGETNQLSEHHYVCPACQSDRVTITDGKEMFLMQLEMA